MADQSQAGANHLPYDTLGLAGTQYPSPANFGRPGLPIVAARRSANTLSWQGWVVLIVVVGSLFGFGAFMAIRQSAKQQAERDAFQPVINDLLFTPVQSGPGESRPRLGKVVLIDVEKKAVDPLHAYMADDLRAVSPEEATSVGQMRYSRTVVGHYSETKTKAVQLSGTLTVVDRATRKVIAKQSFSWGPPPVKVPRTGAREEEVGSAPTFEINRFLADLR